MIKLIYAVCISGCVRPGDILTYKCTVTGRSGGATIWTGNAFNCRYNEIALLHRHFSTNEAYGTCNNGAIVASGLSVDGNNYTSQLNVTVTPDTAGKTIECLYNDVSIITLQLSSEIPNITG